MLSLEGMRFIEQPIPFLQEKGVIQGALPKYVESVKMEVFLEKFKPKLLKAGDWLVEGLTVLGDKRIENVHYVVRTK